MIRAQIQSLEIGADSQRLNVDQIVRAEIQNAQTLTKTEVANLDYPLACHVEILDHVQIEQAGREREVVLVLRFLVLFETFKLL